MPRNAVRYSSVALTATMLAVVATMVAVLVIAPLASALVQRWSRQDVELRTRLVFDSVRNNLTRLLAVSNSAAIGEAFDRLSSDDRVLAVGYCDESDTMRFQTSMMPPGFSCEKAMRSDEASFSPLVSDGVQLIAGTFPITVKNAKGHLVILQDLSFVKERAAEVRTLLTFVLGAIVFVSTALASLAVMVVTQRDMKAVRLAINNLRLGQSPDAGTNLGSLDKELRSMLRQMDTSRISPLNGGQANWTAETVRNVVECELAGAEVIVISNREPYIHNCTNDGGIELQRPASGLVSALEPVTRACGGIWIAHGSGSADRSVVDAADHIRVPPEDPRYTLRRIWINDDELDGYYYGLANEGLWPLCHIAFVRPVFRETDWRTYRVVNEKFADAVAKEATSDAPVVLVQDFHFALLPRMVRERLPNAMIVTFWHIPWPNSETFGICPWKEEIVDGLLGSSILGFHTQAHCNNFIETVDRFIESRIDREFDTIILGGQDTVVRPYPISIEWPPATLATQASVQECRLAVRQRLGLPPETRLAVGIERFDYTKGILDRMRAVLSRP